MPTSQIRSVYIVESEQQGWIIDRLMRDLATELGRRGIATRLGAAGDYAGEDVLLNSRFLTALSDERARVNSLFITHIDDKSKELELRAAFRHFNSLICLSPHDAEFIIALRGDRNGVVGIELPPRDLKVRPVRLALFSARYEDGRKNEQWILDYFETKTPDERDAFVLCFLGWGWEAFCARLAAMEMNYEVYRYSRFTPGEYELYRAALERMDYLLYPGFDGGAMSVYDAFNVNIDVLVSNISYHRGMGDDVVLFDDRAGLYRELDRLYERWSSRVEVLRRRSIAMYANRLLRHWNSLITGVAESDCEDDAGLLVTDERQVLKDFRANYKPLSVSRVRSALIRWVQARLIRLSGRESSSAVRKKA